MHVESHTCTTKALRSPAAEAQWGLFNHVLLKLICDSHLLKQPPTPSCCSHSDSKYLSIPGACSVKSGSLRFSLRCYLFRGANMISMKHFSVNRCDIHTAIKITHQSEPMPANYIRNTELWLVTEVSFRSLSFPCTVGEPASAVISVSYHSLFTQADTAGQGQGPKAGG